MKNKFKVGDTISLHLSEKHLVSGIVYTCSSIPMGKFYQNQFGKNITIEDDIYENALVLIDCYKPGTLTVLTLEQGEGKLFTWNDLFGYEKANYLQVVDTDLIKIAYKKSLLTEMIHNFK